MRSRARESCGVIATSAIECQWYCLARRPAYSTSPWVVAGLGSKQITLTFGTGGAQKSPWPK
jgi:hypothetical protein